ncbi:18288_t:CDS:2, partial [Gigaspora margarita]
TMTTPKTLSSDGKQPTEEKKTEDQEPETKPREKPEKTEKTSSPPSPISPTASLSSAVTTSTTSDNTAPSNNVHGSSAVDTSSIEHNVTPDSSLVPQAPADSTNTLYASPLSISPTIPSEILSSEPQTIQTPQSPQTPQAPQAPQTPQTPQKSSPFSFVKRMMSKKSSQPAVSESPNSSSTPDSVTENTPTDKINGLSTNKELVQEETDIKKIEEPVIIEKEESSEPVTRDIKPELDNENNNENKDEEINEEEVVESDKNSKGVAKVNLRDFITRCSNVVFTKLQQEFDELDRRMYSNVNPAEVRAREINISKIEREQLLEQPDTESDVQSNGNARTALSEAGEALNERGEKLEELNERLTDLGNSSAAFARMAAELKNREANKKWYQVW